MNTKSLLLGLAVAVAAFPAMGASDAPAAADFVNSAANYAAAEHIPYKYNCFDWVTGDADRLPESNIKYLKRKNTITCTATGQHNVCLQLSMDYNHTYSVPQGSTWLWVKGSNLSTDEADSEIWYAFGRQVTAPDAMRVVEAPDGDIVIGWNLASCTDSSQAEIDLGTDGDRIFCFGLTSTTGSSVIKEIGIGTEDDFREAFRPYFTNPVIPADFPDPDVAKLGDTYYFLSTTMQLAPGATLLKSKDLVHWEFCCNPLEKMSDADKYNLLNGNYSYAQGMWAGAIEAHDGKLYILLNCNDAGAFVLSTDNPEGQWEKKRLSRSYYDPGMIMEDGKIYIVCGINHINICELDANWNFKKETKVIVRDDSGLEGSHLYHIGDYYYIYSTYGGWPTGQTIFRSKNITGPYEEKMLMEKWIDGAPNTVHQGALMQTDKGEWWTLLMEDKGAIGRLPSLHPVVWEDGWPTIADNGVPRMQYLAPKVAAWDCSDATLVTDDNFRDTKLGKQWQWNHNAPEGKWSLTDNPGNLRLYTSCVTSEFMLARGTVTQRIFANKLQNAPYGLDGNNPSVGTVALDLAGMKRGDMAGIAVIQDPYAQLAVTVDDAGVYSLVWKRGSHTGADNFTPQTTTHEINMPVGQTRIYLRSYFNCGNSKATFAYSFDNQTWIPVGGETTLRFNLSVFVGARWALFNYSTRGRGTGGYVDIDWFSTTPDCDESVIESGIEDVNVDAQSGDGFTYDLYGRRVDSPTAPGIYIVNGRKVIRK